MKACLLGRFFLLAFAQAMCSLIASHASDLHLRVFPQMCRECLAGSVRWSTGMVDMRAFARSRPELIQVRELRAGRSHGNSNDVRIADACTVVACTCGKSIERQCTHAAHTGYVCMHMRVCVLCDRQRTPLIMTTAACALQRARMQSLRCIVVVVTCIACCCCASLCTTEICGQHGRTDCVCSQSVRTHARVHVRRCTMMST